MNAIQPQLLDQSTIFKFANSEAPDSVLLHPGMIGQAERRALFGLAQAFWQPNSVIIDAGAFLGASTKAFCEALCVRRFTTHCVHTYEYAIFNEYNAKLASELLGINTVPGQKFGGILQDLVNDNLQIVKYHIGDIQNFPYDYELISLAFFDVLKSVKLLDSVYGNFFPRFSDKTILYQQDYFHPAHPWIAYSMAKFAGAFSYAGRPDPDSGALNAAIFTVKDKTKIPNSIRESGASSKDEVIDLMNKATAMHEHPIEKLNLVGLRCTAQACFIKDTTHNTNTFKQVLRDLGLGNYLDDPGQKHHVNRILRTVKLFSENSTSWT